MNESENTDQTATTPLDRQFQRNAELHGERLALADDPGRPEWNGSPALSLSYAEVERRIAALGARFEADGLSPGSILALAAPSMAETVVVLLAALRAQLIVALVPPLWRWRDASAELTRLKAKALVTTSAIDGEQTALRWRGIASEIATIDRLYGFGAGVPPDFQDISHLEEAGGPASRGDGERIATITMGSIDETGGTQFQLRTHGHWQAAGDAFAAEAPLRFASSFLLPFSLCGLTGIGAGLMPWLRCAGALHLHHFRSLASLVSHAADVEPDVLLLPGQLADAVHANLERRNASTPAMTVAVWKDRFPERRATTAPPRRGWLDLTVLDDLGFIAAARTSAQPTPLPLATGNERGAGFGIEIKIAGRPQRAGDGRRGLIGGKLALRGAMVPPAGPLGIAGLEDVESGVTELANGFVRSATSARIVEGPGAIPDGRDEEFLSVGGIAVSTADLDHFYSSQDDIAEAACFAFGSSGHSRVGVAIVMRPGVEPIAAAAFCRGLSFAGAALHQLPEIVVTVDGIPRRGDGSIDRHALAAMAATVPDGRQETARPVRV